MLTVIMIYAYLLVVRLVDYLILNFPSKSTLIKMKLDFIIQLNLFTAKVRHDLEIHGGMDQYGIPIATKVIV